MNSLLKPIDFKKLVYPKLNNMNYKLSTSNREQHYLNIEFKAKVEGDITTVQLQLGVLEGMILEISLKTFNNLR